MGHGKLPIAADPYWVTLCSSTAPGTYSFKMRFYIIQTRDGKQLDRHLNWVEACDPAQLFRTLHKDIALNQLIELNASNIHLRASVAVLDSDGADASPLGTQQTSVTL